MNIPLPIHLLIHLFFSLLAGFIAWRIWKKPLLLGLFFGFIGGFLIDLDHFIDYYLAFGLNWNWRYFEKGYSFLKLDKIYVLFHGWEYVIILVLLVFLFRNKCLKMIFLSLALGVFFHLVTDVIIDDVPIRSYSLNYRIKHEFKIVYINSQENYERYLDRKEHFKLK